MTDSQTTHSETSQTTIDETSETLVAPPVDPADFPDGDDIDSAAVEEDGDYTEPADPEAEYDPEEDF